MELYLKSKQMSNIVDLLNDSKGADATESVELNIEDFKTALSKVDSQMKMLPATAQVLDPFMNICILAIKGMPQYVCLICFLNEISGCSSRRCLPCQLF